MDSSDEDSIIPILYQIEEFETRKNKQCTALKSALNVATVKNEELTKKMDTCKDQIKQLDEECSKLKTSLSESNSQCENFDRMLIAAEAKNEEFTKQIQILQKFQTTAEICIKERDKKCENLKLLWSTCDFKLKDLQKSYNTTTSQLKELKEKNRNLELTLESSLQKSENKCASLELSLIEANNTIERINTKFNDLNSACLAMKTEKDELITKCETLERSLNSANAKIEQLELQLSESKKENTKNAKLRKKKLIMAALKKVDDKLSKNPLHPIIDRMQRNIEKLDKITTNSTLYSEQINEVEICEDLSSDYDDRSTLSYVSDRYIDEELLVRFSDHSQSNIFQNISEVFSDESVLAIPISSSNKNCDNLENTAQNDRLQVQIEVIDDSSCDSDISLNVNTNVSTPSVEEEHSYSSEKSLHLKKTVPVTSDSNQSAVIVDNSTSNEEKIEKRVTQDNFVKLSEEKSQLDCTKVPNLNGESYPIENYKTEINRLQETIESLMKKTHQSIKLLYPVVLLERCEDEDKYNR